MDVKLGTQVRMILGRKIRIFWSRTESKKELETETGVKDLSGGIRKRRFTYLEHL